MQLTTTFLASLTTLSSITSVANAHGYFTNPKGRQPGTAYQNACGQQAYYNMMGSINGNIQGLEQVVANQDDYNPDECWLWKCKGLKYADNVDNVQTYAPGQTIPLTFTIAAPHTGHANISIIDLSTPSGTILASNLKHWPTYASTSTPIQTSQEDFSITMPEDLPASKCEKGGECAIQMFWDAPGVSQTYESCIDFVVKGASGKRDGEAGRGHARDFGVREVGE